MCVCVICIIRFLKYNVTLIYNRVNSRPQGYKNATFHRSVLGITMILLFFIKNISIVECMSPSYAESSRLIHWNPRVPNFMCQGRVGIASFSSCSILRIFRRRFLERWWHWLIFHLWWQISGKYSLFHHSAHMKPKKKLFLGRKFPRKTRWTGSLIDGTFRSRVMFV